MKNLSVSIYIKKTLADNDKLRKKMYFIYILLFIKKFKKLIVMIYSIEMTSQKKQQVAKHSIKGDE